MGYLKGKSSLMIFDRHANMKYKYGNRHFWCRGYYVDTVGKNTKKIAEYIRNQLQEDIANDQLTLFENIDPFTGEKYKKSNYSVLKANCPWNIESSASKAAIPAFAAVEVKVFSSRKSIAPCSERNVPMTLLFILTIRRSRSA